VTLCSCANQRVFYKGSTVCTATNRHTNDWRYFKIELGTPSKPYAGDPALWIRPKDGAEFRTDQVTVTSILSRPGVKVAPFRVPVSDSPPFEPWPAGTEEYRAGSVVYVVTSNCVLHIMLVHSGEFQKVGEDRWHSLPCTEQDIREVFGSPDRITSGFENELRTSKSTLR
jgi:hypothetical protein